MSIETPGLDAYFGQDAERRAAERVAQELMKPVPEKPEEQHDGTFDPWALFPGVTGGYNSDVDVLAIMTLKAIRDRTTFNLLDGPDGTAAELFLGMFCGHHYGDYGTSPRGTFPTVEVKVLMDQWIEKYEQWFRVVWADED